MRKATLQENKSSFHFENGLKRLLQSSKREELRAWEGAAAKNWVGGDCKSLPLVVNNYIPVSPHTFQNDASTFMSSIRCHRKI